VYPNNYFAHQKFADSLVEAKQFDQAFSHYKTALELNVFDVRSAHRFARALAICDDHGRRDYDLAVRLAEWANELTEAKHPKVKRTLAIVHNNWAETLRASGAYAQAMDRYRQAIEADPSYPPPMLNLALLLSTCEDKDLRDPDEAVRLANRARRASPKLDANSLMILAIAYAEAGHSGQAVSTTEEAIRAARADGDVRLALLLRDRLRLFRSQLPDRESKD
jgi:tetratricopeptide (TPR) repeat protein